MYKIVISYGTGDSVSTWDKESEIAPTWKDKNKAKEALRRIAEHYEWYKSTLWTHLDGELEVPKFSDPDNPKGALYLTLDDGTEFRVGTFWIGYFEGLNKAYIAEEGLEYIP